MSWPPKHALASLPEAPVEWDLFVEKDVVEAPLGAVLGHYGDIRHLDAAADELAQIGVVQLPGHTAEALFGIAPS